MSRLLRSRLGTRGSPQRWSAGLLGLALAIGLASPAWADPPAGVPGGPCIEDQQQVQLDSLPSYQEVARQLASIEQSSQGAVEAAAPDGRVIDPGRMTEEQWLTNRQMALLSVDAVQRLGTGNAARYPLIDITNAVISRMLLGGPGPDGSDPHFRTQGAIFYEVRSVGQKSNGMLEQLFVRPTMAVLAAAADRSLYAHPGTGWEDIPFGEGEPCGGGPS
jgi:hypothetical protein